eukprot:CAMPEP_0205910262 /NCGR_PEP_ID=MMETSP1325-20131115/4336_1 /ASSEMBLY_ACC=CAM_ASM_000708 /TAXON_ID=236786 /ORGANISM="Florenciella sp., Strain RCC1007" /LENGTH=67 /DNA_ID=CAMNT_0053276605 /DNA_START=1133 /DNA_END=1333 /DNA_ORIENTATION=+
MRRGGDSQRGRYPAALGARGSRQWSDRRVRTDAQRTALVELEVNGTAVQSRGLTCPPTRAAVPIADG